MRTDPTDNGGLFIGRRPGTAPVRYRDLPEHGSERRRRADRTLAAALLAGIALISLMFWGPIPVLWLWVGSMVDYHTGSVSFGILVAFVGLLLMLLVGLSLMRRLDEAWILVRRAAGYDQRTGMLSVIFATTAAIGVSAFLLWFLILHGPGSNLFSPRA